MTIKSKAEQGKQAVQAQAAKAGDVARRAKTKAADGIDSFPVAALAGGLVIGALIGSLLPRTKQEEDLLGPIGEALNDRAKDAVVAARDAGQAKLDELGISKDAAGKQVGKLIESIAQVAESAGSAAVVAARH